MGTREQHVIVGAGQAGSTAAFAMRRAGFQGRILMIGAEPERPYERPPLSKEVLTAAEPACPYLSSAERYTEAGIEVLLGATVEAIEPAAQRLRVEGREPIAYDKLLIATGGRARRLPIPGGDEVFYLRDYADALRIRAAVARAEQVVCIGAGVIGLEIAASARALGCRVVVVEVGSAVMGRCLAPSDAQFMEELHRSEGVELRLSSGVAAVETAANGRKRVILADGSVLAADCVVAGVGMERNIALAASAGLEIGGGIAVDAGGRTSLPQIFAAGDVAAFLHPLFGRRMLLESWHHAQDHGALVGRVMAGAEETYEAIPRFWTDQHGVNLQVAGLPTEAVETVTRGDPDDRTYTAFHLDPDGIVVAVTAVNNGRDMRPGIEMIRQRRKPDREMLADAGVPLRKLAA
jgi:3-phenylpropionate/trans-cinnamate dioxygenase ferredoxin reductase subunit